MNRKATYLFLLFSTCLLLTATATYAQEENKDNGVVTETRDLPPFTSIKVGGAFELYLAQDGIQVVKVETEEKNISKVRTEVRDNTLFLEAQGLRNFRHLKIYVTVPRVEKIEASGASEVNGETVVSADKLHLLASGASEIDLELDVDELVTELSGASEMKLSGRADQHSAFVSGAADLHAVTLVSLKTRVDVSGAAHASLSGTGETIRNISGAADVSIAGKPASGNDSKMIVITDEDDDTVFMKIPGANVRVVQGDDTVRVQIGNREIVVDEDGKVKYYHNKKKKFNGHWAGFELGINGYVNSDYNMKFPKEYEYMDLRMEKSIATNINFFEQNVSFARNQKWGMTTGLGLGWNDFRFTKPTRLNSDSAYLIGYIYQDISIRKSKLTAMYLTLPLIFEFQTNSQHKKNSFHIGIGGIVSARLRSHTKVYYNELNKDYELVRYNTATGSYEVAAFGKSPGEPKAKEFKDWYLQPFKFDATVRIGWGWINLFANFQINSMFRQGKGPELFPWTAGIALVNF